MRIAQILNGFPVALSNQEIEFIDQHKNKIRLNGLSEQEIWIAQNLVRKGVYSISKDNQSLIKKLDESNPS